ncbi:hypothetical protein BS78_02G065500 [Paspalum vaginatum]|nr:hypothetical protein BS78_02G065500 [Paspalum vaginatum]
MEPSPELIVDTTTEILLHLPPDDPACLVRATLICKPWRRILSDPTFSRRYRKFHRTPPLLGYLRCHYPYKNELFATTAFPFSCSRWRTARGRGGTDGCDHLSCYGGPYRVVFGLNGSDHVTRVFEYSSETGLWSPPASIPRVASFAEGRCSLYTGGGALYFTFQRGKGFLRYDLADDEQGRLSVTNVPEWYENQTVRSTMGIVDEEGRLGFAALDHDKDELHIWSWQVGPDGAAKWEQTRVVDLKPLFPIDISTLCLSLSGFAKVSGTILISTGSGIFALELKSSGLARTIHDDEWHCAIMPYLTFYTPGFASGRLSAN